MTSQPPEQDQPKLDLSMIYSAGRLVAWVGASATALGIILAAFGYLVETAYLARFGVRRGVLDLGQNEYILSGGQFLIGLLPLALAGALELALRRWYLVLLAAAIATLGCWRRLGQSFRWIALAVLHGTWLVLALSALEGASDPATARAQVAMLTFTTLAAGVYAWLGDRLAAAISVAWRVPYFAVLQTFRITRRATP
jgi:hypothetical protein